MKNIKLIYSLLLFTSLILFSACEKEVQIDIPGFKEQLVIDGRIETNQPPFILISKSKDIFSPTDLNSYIQSFVSGATVTVSDGTNNVELIEICTDNLPAGAEAFAESLFGLPAEELANLHLCVYTSFNPSIFGQVGKTYTLNVSYEGNSYSSATELLPPIAFDSLFWKPSNSYPEYGYSHVFLTDPIAKNDSYMWEVKRINKTSEGKERDPFYTKTFSPVFNDEFINGLTFEFWYENPMSFKDEQLAKEFRGYYKKGDSVVVKFSKLDPNVFEFFEKKYIQMSTAGSPFAAPTNIPSNIKGGALGVWAGFSPYFDTLFCQ
jgi:hypothetical protein